MEHLEIHLKVLGYIQPNQNFMADGKNHHLKVHGKMCFISAF